MDTLDTVNKTHWLRASIMGANDGIISTGSLMMGVASSGGDKTAILIAGISSLIAGAMAMATGEYISVSIERDSEISDINQERDEIIYNWEGDTHELVDLYVDRGLPEHMAEDVASFIMEQGVSKAENLKDVGIIPIPKSKPFVAAIASAISFSIGALLPILITFISLKKQIELDIFISTLFSLSILGFISAKMCNSANIWKIILRVLIWGTISLLMTLIIPAII